jgi:hypothetical protein
MSAEPEGSGTGFAFRYPGVDDFPKEIIPHGTVAQKKRLAITQPVMNKNDHA